ncbi:MAG: hypothetical protein JST12_07630 [Armatimonadetes bacterium]|nr:hypothetical protein [Armatimonadota bacterium]MBS1701514.1 hypothetical protein [Armatimonadota bacterium]MBS1728667.1 hypothetical protein [Armatimonadota bacterium]
MMKKTLIFTILAAISISLIGCGSDPGVTVGQKRQDTSQMSDKAKKGIADDTATPAPAGVKTGTPGG